MKLEQSNLNEYLKSLPSSGRKALFIFFPNFEERSVTAAEIVVRHTDIQSYSDAMVCWLQGNRPTEILDAVKQENKERTVAACRRLWPELAEMELPYPVQYMKVFHSAVRERLAALAPLADLIIDISATPRDLLFQLFEVLFPVLSTSSFQIEDTIIGSIYFIYSWANDYPISSAPETLGNLIGYHSRKSLPELLLNKNKVQLVVCGAGTGHDALQCVTVTDKIVKKSKLTKDVFFLHNRNNSLRSFNQMMRHQSLVNYLGSHDERFNTVFSVEHFSEKLTEIARGAANDHRNGESSFIIGAFGPKPLGLCAYFATREYMRLSYENGTHSNTVDILDLDGAQYLTLYSLGVDGTDIYKVSTELYNAKPF